MDQLQRLQNARASKRDPAVNPLRARRTAIVEPIGDFGAKNERDDRAAFAHHPIKNVSDHVATFVNGKCPSKRNRVVDNDLNSAALHSTRSLRLSRARSAASARIPCDRLRCVTASQVFACPEGTRRAIGLPLTRDHHLLTASRPCPRSALSEFLASSVPTSRMTDIFLSQPSQNLSLIAGTSMPRQQAHALHSPFFFSSSISRAARSRRRWSRKSFSTAASSARSE